MRSDTRSFPRKVLRCHALVKLPGGALLPARTLDIALGGVCVTVGEQLHVGQQCTLAFEAPLNGRMVRVTGAAKVVYCILAGTDGFRTGLQFVEMDAANSKTLAELMI